MAETDPFRASRNNRQMLLIAGAALAVAIALFALWYFVIRTPMEPAFTDLKTEDASLIVDELKRQKTPYKLAENGTVIMVPQDQVDAARVSILGGDLPLRGTVGFELFNKTDMGLTEFAQKINYQRALQGELARTLMSLRNVDTARVHLSLPESEIFENDRRAAKASVTLTPKLGETINGNTVLGVQRMVASAVPDLEANGVTVLDGTGRLLSQEVPVTALSAESEAPGSIASVYSAKVREAIAPVTSDPLVRITTWTPPDARIEAPVSGQGEGTVGSGAERSFPIRITIAVPGFPAPGMRERMMPLLAQSVGFDPLRGDSLTLIAQPGDSAAALPPVAAATASAPSETSAQVPAFPLWPAIAGAAIVGLALLAIRQAMRRGEMTLSDREAFAARLQNLLDDREGDRA